MKSLKIANDTNSAISVQQNSSIPYAQISHPVPQLIERKRQLEADISAKQAEIAEVDRHIEAAALRSANSDEEELPDLSSFRDSIRRLLINLWNATDNVLSHDAIKAYVLLDEISSNNAVYDIIREARKEIEKQGFLYKIDNVWGRGYQLVKRTV